MVNESPQAHEAFQLFSWFKHNSGNKLNYGVHAFFCLLYILKSNQTHFCYKHGSGMALADVLTSNKYVQCRRQNDSVIKEGD